MTTEDLTPEHITAPRMWALMLLAPTLFLIYLLHARLIAFWVLVLRGEWASVPDPGGGVFLTSGLLVLVFLNWIVICRSSVQLNSTEIAWLSPTGRPRQLAWSEITHVEDLIPKAEINWHMGKVVLHHHGGKKTKISGLLFGDKARHVWSIIASNVPHSATVSPEDGVLAGLRTEGRR